VWIWVGADSREEGRMERTSCYDVRRRLLILESRGPLVSTYADIPRASGIIPLAETRYSDRRIHSEDHCTQTIFRGPDAPHSRSTFSVVPPLPPYLHPHSTYKARAPSTTITSRSNSLLNYDFRDKITQATAHQINPSLSQT
jgi:hypothetical protein